MRVPAAARAATMLLAVPGSADAADAVSGRLIVGFTAGTNHQRAASLVQGAGARIERRLDRIGALAPGDEIFSTHPTSSYKLLTGTSMAAPMVAATAAMLHAQDSRLIYSQIRSAIKASVVPDAALAGKTVTGGLLNLDGALHQAG